MNRPLVLLTLLLLLAGAAHAEPVVGTYATVKENIVGLGQLAVITIEPHPSRPLAISITDGTNTFRYNGQQIGASIGFQPQMIGEHRLLIRDAISGETLETLHFLVGERPKATIAPLAALNTSEQPPASDDSPQNDTAAPQSTVLPTRTNIVTSDKQNYLLGEPVDISMYTNETGLHLNIIFNDQVFRFLGDLAPVTRFQPKEPGAYRVAVSGAQGAVIDSFVFVVHDAQPADTPAPGAQEIVAPGPDAQNLTAALAKTSQRIKLRDAHGQAVDGTLRIKERGKPELIASLLDAQELPIAGGVDIDFTPAMQGNIQHVRVSNLLAGTLDLGLDEFSSSPVALPQSTDPEKTVWSSLYAIDPTNVNASNITVTVTATGTELYTCKDWDYASRECLGAWVKVRDVVPGENYTLTLDSADPGFGETISIPSGGYTQTTSGTTFTIKLCTTATCTNTSTVFDRGDTVYVAVNATAAYIRTTAKNLLEVYPGSDTGAITSVAYNCTPASVDGPYSYCYTNFTIDQSWTEGWYYIDSEQLRTQAGGIYTTWRTPFIVGPESELADSLKFFADSGYTRETEMFGTGQQVYVQFNFTEAGQVASATNSLPQIRDFKDTPTTGGTTVTESFSNTNGPYRFNFSMPNMGAINWYYLAPNMRNTSNGQLPSGAEVHGRMIRFQNNTVPGLPNVTTNSPPNDPRSTGQRVNWTVSVNDTDEVDKWTVYICSTNSFNNATMACGATAVCSNTTYSRLKSRTCEVTATGSMSANNTGYAFVCDARNCSIGRAVNWSIVNDVTAPTVTLVTPINDPSGSLPLTGFAATFNYVPEDNYGFANCSLYTNATGSWSRVSTNTSIANGTNNYLYYSFPADGAYLWNVQCSDYAGNSRFGANNYTLFVSGPPIVNLRTPANASAINTLTANLTYNVTYGSDISNCSLYINGALNQTMFNITQGAAYTFPAAFPSDGTYNWNVQCVGSDGRASFGDGVANAGMARTIFVDTTAPSVTLLSPASGATIPTSSVDLTYSASDNIGVANCSLFVDGVVISSVTAPQNGSTQTVPFLLNNGEHPWYVVCADGSGNVNTSQTRTVIINSSAAGSATYYETNYANVNPAAPANINLSTTVDGTENTVISNLPATTMQIFTRASTAAFQGNGILINANSTVNFSGMFSAARANTGYITWRLYKSNTTTGDTLIAQAGNDATGGTLISATGKAAYRASATAPASPVRILGTEWLKLQVNVYNTDSRRRAFTHYIDNTSSYVMFNFTRLGVLTTDITIPATNLTVGVNDTFLVTCAYSCSGGACTNTRITVERNSSATAWTPVSGSAGPVILNGTETNPHNFSVVNFPGGTTTFVLKANATGVSRLRCNATSDYSNALVVNTRTVTIGTQGIPTVTLLSPANNAFTSAPGINFSYIVSSNKNLVNCSLYVNGALNQTNTTPLVDVASQFAVASIMEGAYTWSVSCTDVSGVQGNSSTYNLRVDRGPPSVALNSPATGTNYTTDSITFNWTAVDGVDAAPTCNLTIDGTARASGVNSPSNTPTTRTISGLSIGVHNWNVTCADDAGNPNTSETRMFNITNLPNNVTLLFPPTNTWNNSATVVLYYNVTHPLSWQPANCSLLRNGTAVQSNATPVLMNQSNNFSTSWAEGAYSWSVQCIQPDGVQNTSASRTLYIDRTLPYINLTNPPNASALSIFNVPFSFNVTDHMASSLTCSLNLDAAVNKTGIAAVNRQNTTTTVNGIADGNHNWSVTCADLAGNTNTSVSYEFSAIAPPVVTLLNPPNNGFNKTADLVLRYNVSENNALAGCTLYFDGALNQANQTPVANYNVNNFSINGVAEGQHTWMVSCADVSGYVGNSTMFNLTVDYTNPNVTLNGPGNDSLIRSPVVVVNWTAADNIDQTLSCNITRVGPDGTDTSKKNIASPNNTLTSATFSGLPDGLHRWNVTCADDAGNNASSATFQYNVSALPSVTLVSPANNNVNNSASVTLQYVPLQSYGIANCTLLLDGQENQTNASIANGANNYFWLSAVSQGSHNWSVNCTDNTGGTQNSTTWRFTLDLTAPTITLNNPLQAAVQANNTVGFNYTPSDSQSSTMVCNLTINGSVYAPNQAVASGSNQVTSVTLRGGNASYEWNVTCRDSAYNINTSETRSFSIIAPPVVRLISPANSTGISPNTTFTYFAQDPFGIKNCSLLLDGSVVNSTTSVMNNSNNNLSAWNIAPGPHLWSVMCYDDDNELYTAPEQLVSSDVTPPAVTLNAPPQGALFAVSTTLFNWTAIDDYSPTLSCTLYLDGANRSTVVSANSTPASSTLASIPDGVHDWNVTCRDMVWNTNTSETRQFTTNQTPTIALGAPANNAFTNNATVVFTFTPTDNDGFANCSLLFGGALNTTNQSPVRNGLLNNFTLTLPTAQYNWSVQCFDNGTFSLRNTTTERALTVNLIAPNITLNAPASGFVTNTSAITFNWTASETFGGALSCNITINSTVRAQAVNSPSGTPTTTTINGLNDSLQLWNVTCVDPAGNVNTSATWNYTVVEPPSVTLASPNNGLRTNATTINFTFTPTDNSGQISACSLLLNGVVNRTINNPQSGVLTNITVSGFMNGSYSWSINCTDPNGNMGNSSQRTLLIDRLPPHITLTAPPNGSAIGTNVTFNWTANDTGTVVTCNHTIDGAINASGLAGVSGVPFTRLVTNVAEGPHNWSVTCWDDLGQTNTSLTYEFIVNSPDLVLNDTARIGFNNTNPNENDTINITANVTNIGGIVASNAMISFWDGQPGNGGVLIGNATATINPNQSVVVSTRWNITLGFHTIYAVADYDGLITEMDKGNNNASRNISVLRVLITSPPNATLTNNATPTINFTVQNFTGGTFTYAIYVDGARNGQNGTVTDNTSQAVVLSALSEGVHRIIVQANDSTRAKNSTPLTITIDQTPPAGAFITANGTFFRQTPLNVTIRANDTYDASINYTLFIDGVQNVTGSAANATLTNITIDGLANGIYNLTIQTTDDAGNSANSSPIIIYVDNIEPIITLNAPADGAAFSVRNIVLNYTPSDNLDPLLACTLTLDGSNVSSANAPNGTPQTYSAASLAEGTHAWNVTCWDGLNSINQVNNLATSATRTFGVYIPPNITLLAPQNNTVSNNATQVFLFNASDETGLANCSLLIGGVVNTTKTTAQLTLNGTSNFTVTGLNNSLSWSVMCVDNSTGYATAYSENRTLTIDLVPPSPVINTPNGTWFSNSSPRINITVTDNFDAIINWTLFVDGIANASGSAANGTPVLGVLNNIPDGAHAIVLQAFDDAGNYANSSEMTIYVDSVAPLVTLVSPANDTNLSVTYTTLNFTATDNVAQVLRCDLILDGGVVAQYNLTNGTYAIYSTGDLPSGYHYWNATCLDNATNRGTSATFRFYIQLPDLAIDASNITLSNSTPAENQTITVTARVFNIGLLNASNITVQLWRGDPGSAGSAQVGTNQTIPLLGIGENVTLSFNYTAVIGLNQIYVVLDPPLATNGSIRESNESNNKAHSDVWVGLFEVFAGGHDSRLRIADSGIIAAFTWNQSNVTGSNVFVADSESVIAFTSLQAIGRNTTNGTATGASDFVEIDAKINATALNDSINRTFTAGGSPIQTMTITAFRRPIANVPVINSTDTESFVTGILWDTSDGGVFYNGTQDVVFVTVMNQSRAGRYGTYDYEIAVPATLRDYTPGGGTVTFYTELR